MPLIIKGTIVGALTIYSEVPQAFDTEEVDLMRHLSDVVTLGMRATDDKAKYEAHA